MSKRGPRPPGNSAPPFEQLLAQAKMTNALLASQLLLHMTQQDVVGLLRATGASLQQIAEVLGTSYASVAVASGRLRKQSAQQKQGIEHGDTQEQGAPEADLRETGTGREQP